MAQVGADARQNSRVLVPSSVRLDSRVLFLHTSSVWTTNSVFCVLLLHKLAYPARPLHSASWWLVFLPLFIGHALHVAVLAWVLLTAKARVSQQLGPPPPVQASATLRAHYHTLCAIAIRSHIIDNTNALLDSLAALSVKVQFALLLDQGRLSSASLRTVFAPIWAVWATSCVLVCAKHRQERTLGSQRDLLYVFLLMVALKVDGASSLPWMWVFTIPWVWLSCLFLLAVVVMVSVSCARGWRRVEDLLMPVGFMLLLFSASIPQFIFCRNLVTLLDEDTGVTYEAVLVPAAASWAAMWAASGVMCLGLRTRERARAALLASGAVWRVLNESLGPDGGRGGVQAEQQRVDAMTEAEVVELAESRMQQQGLSPPSQLMRLGPSLYKSVGTDAGGSADAAQAAGGPGGPQQTEQRQTQQTASGDTPHKVTIQMSEGIDTAATWRQDQACGQQASAPQTSLSATHPSQHVPHHPQPQQQEQLIPGILHESPGIAALLGISHDPTAYPGMPQVPGTSGQEEPEDGTCVICYDAQASCVLLECGHGGFCRRCAHLLLVRPPHVCPTCRTSITMVAQLESVNPVGCVSQVKAPAG